jgi:RNA-directed DNA polymerase
MVRPLCTSTQLLTQLLQTRLPLHRQCTHVKWHGGHKAAVRQTHYWLAGGHYHYVAKTDIRAYYANINKAQLFALLQRHITCPVILDLLQQFLYYTVEKGCNFHTPRLGIPRASSLSPLLAGFHLYELDRDLARRTGVRYLRFMDDLIILACTPDKTWIDSIQHSFDWLGYQYDGQGLRGVTARALAQCTLKLHRLFEKARAAGHASTASCPRVVTCLSRWRRWLHAELPPLVSLPPPTEQATPAPGC